MTDVKISALPVASSATTADLVPIVQSGVTKQLTNALLFTNSSLTTPNIGTPSAGTLTNCTGLPIASGVSGLASGAATFLATPTSSNLGALLTDETGSGGFAMFSNAPTLTAMLKIPTYVVSAAGSTYGDAAAVTTGFTKVTGADGTKGVILPTAEAGLIVIIKNAAASTLKIYPATADRINALTITTGNYDIAAQTATILIAYDNLEWYSVPLVAS